MNHSLDLHDHLHDHVALDEIELYAEVLIAVADADRPLSPEEIDRVVGLPAFGATMGGDPGDAYGRFVVVELDDGRGAFMLGVNTEGGDGASEDIDAAFDSLGTR
ncbi:hypothetical protein [Nocardiopsis sp. RV163]|uniref:hypothetical protein n=1 Tax=Nocardiopsis sp. RV163 TaxID=1661388 RepID=UPI00064BB3CC|nr:hypothetical protein [Nocardiopsis sp. RV163]